MTKEEEERKDASTRSGETLSQEKTVGEILLEAREGANLSLEDVSEETKIPKRMLEYLETDNFEAFPARVYARGFLKSYASLLGLDVEYILNKFEVQTTQSHKSRGDMWEIETEVVEESIAPPGILKKVIIGIVVLLVIILVIKLVSRGEKKPEPPRVPSIEEELFGGREGSPPSSMERKAEEEKKETGEPAKREEADVIVPEEMELVITANPTDSVWFEIAEISSRNGNPDTSMYNFLLLPGQRRVFRATDLFFIRKVGNAGGFKMTLDGRELPTVGRKGVVRRNIAIGRDYIGGAR